MTTHRVGGEVDAFCTRCKLTLAHTILAMVGSQIARVRCNTCGGDHTFRSAPGARAPSASPRAPRPEKQVIGFEARLAGKDLAAARRYSPKETFALDEVVNHPTFGLGIVTAVRGDKVDIAFKADVRTLVHGRGEPAPKPSFQPPRASAGGPADKPLGDEPPQVIAEPPREETPT